MSFAGLTFIQSPHMTEMVEDWSKVRSPGRAARRRRQGHRQNIVMRQAPRKDCLRMGDKVFIHPETYRQVQRTMDEFAVRHIQPGLPWGLP